jgi:general secretion pathway protein G
MNSSLPVANPTARPDRLRAFTLMELVVVITIIGILGTLVAMKVGPIIFQSQRTKIASDLRRIVEAAKLIQVSGGTLPAGLEELVQPKDADGNDLPGLEEFPLDPWKRPYSYEVRNGSPVARCLGRDGEVGGEGEDADLEWPAPRE